MTTRPPNRRQLSPEDVEAILQLAEEGVGELEIARRFGRPRSSIAWHLYRHGYKAARPREAITYRRRDGRVVRRYGPEEDRVLLDLRAQGLSIRAIAAELTKRFGYPRKPHSVRVRLILIAARED